MATHLKDAPLPSVNNPWTTWGTAIDAELRNRAVSVWQIDSFDGASDDAKHVAAWAAAAAATRKPILQYPARTFGPLSTPIAAFSGMHAIGPDGNDGTKNQEISSGNLVNHKVSVSCGTGTSSMFVQSSSINDVVFSNISWSGTSGSQWWHNTNGSSYSIYPGQFHSLSFDGFSSVLGSASSKFTITQVVFSGHWTILNFSASTPVHIGGSDCPNLWKAGMLNIQSPASVAGSGNPIILIDYLEKSCISNVYCTNDNGWTGIRVVGPTPGRAVRLRDCVIEGRAAGTPATAPCLDVQGQYVILDGVDIGQVTTANGVIVQSGGILNIKDAYYRRASAVGATYPLLYQTGGLYLRTGAGPLSANSEAVRMRWADTSTYDYAYPTANVT